MPASFVNIRPVRVDGTSHPSEPPSADRVHAAVYRVLDGTPLCAWSTVTAGSTAHVSIGYFAHSRELYFYLLSHPGSLHCRNVGANPSMAIAVFESAQNWSEPGRGVQLFGKCKEVADADTPQVESIYSKRYEAYWKWKATLRASDPALDYRFYRFVPERLKILDETEFGDAVFVVADIVRTR